MPQHITNRIIYIPTIFIYPRFACLAPLDQTLKSINIDLGTRFTVSSSSVLVLQSSKRVPFFNNGLALSFRFYFSYPPEWDWSACPWRHLRHLLFQALQYFWQYQPMVQQRQLVGGVCTRRYRICRDGDWRGLGHLVACSHSA